MVLTIGKERKELRFKISFVYQTNQTKKLKREERNKTAEFKLKIVKFICVFCDFVFLFVALLVKNDDVHK